jgi:L-ribulokinase
MSVPNTKYVIGLDCGTESCRALLVDVTNGAEIAAAVYPYRHGVITGVLPETEVELKKDWALQDPADYLEGFKTVIPQLLQKAEISGESVIGIGIDFTACTVLPTLADGTPLCFLERYRKNPHAWVKLWKHHAAQPEADQINQLAMERHEPFLAYYGGKISSEWALPKLLQIFNEAPEIYKATARFIEAGDWIVWQMTGQESRNACAAGYKGLWTHENGYPGSEFLAALKPGFKAAITDTMQGPIIAPGRKVGTLTRKVAKELGLTTEVAVSAATIDAHAGVPGCGVGSPGKMVMIMGTSSCQMVMTKRAHFFNGFAGIVKDGILPGYYGYEYGQSAVGDIFAWFIENAVPYQYYQEAESRGLGLYALLEEKAAGLMPGENDLVALDWQNGNRSILMNANLRGVVTGYSLRTKPEAIYRALIEATAFGTRKIVETHENGAEPIDEFFACGGLTKNHMLMQIYADVLGRPVKIASSAQPVALGAAIFGALAAGNAAGGYDNSMEAVQKMIQPATRIFAPNEMNHHRYQNIYQHYLKLHDYFGVL